MAYRRTPGMIWEEPQNPTTRSMMLLNMRYSEFKVASATSKTDSAKDEPHLAYTKRELVRKFRTPEEEFRRSEMAISSLDNFKYVRHLYRTLNGDKAGAKRIQSSGYGQTPETYHMIRKLTKSLVKTRTAPNIGRNPMAFQHDANVKHLYGRVMWHQIQAENGVRQPAYTMDDEALKRMDPRNRRNPMARYPDLQDAHHETMALGDGGAFKNRDDRRPASSAHRAGAQRAIDLRYGLVPTSEAARSRPASARPPSSRSASSRLASARLASARPESATPTSSRALEEEISGEKPRAVNARVPAEWDERSYKQQSPYYWLPTATDWPGPRAPLPQRQRPSTTSAASPYSSGGSRAGGNTGGKSATGGRPGRAAKRRPTSAVDSEKYGLTLPARAHREQPPQTVRSIRSALGRGRSDVAVFSSADPYNELKASIAKTIRESGQNSQSEINHMLDKCAELNAHLKDQARLAAILDELRVEFDVKPQTADVAESLLLVEEAAEAEVEAQAEALEPEPEVEEQEPEAVPAPEVEPEPEPEPEPWPEPSPEPEPEEVPAPEPEEVPAPEMEEPELPVATREDVGPEAESDADAAEAVAEAPGVVGDGEEEEEY